jgi:hypothetical protein
MRNEISTTAFLAPGRGPSQWRVCRMALTAEQYSDLATTCDGAAADILVPSQQRASFAKKADYFRLLARLAAKQEAAVQAAKLGAKIEANPPQPVAGSLPPDFLRRPKKRAQDGPETPAYHLALMHLALRWRLFKLTTETFGGSNISNDEPRQSTPTQH